MWTRGGRSRAHRQALSIAWLVVASAVVAGLSPVSVASAAPEGAIRYVYDDAGRLKAVVDPASETGIYTWDVVGNLLSVSRQASHSVQVLQVSPGSGPVGTSVRIAGTGFDSTASQNTVTFNSGPATVTSATPSELTALVPAAATSGPVTVTTAEGSATSDSPFTVTPPGAPTISGISPPVAAPGDQVTISGQAFASLIADNDVGISTARSEVTSATATSLEVVVPPATGSGRVSVSTPDGTATGPDLFIPPTGMAPADVTATARIQVGDTHTVTIPTSGTVGLVAFDGTAGQSVSLQPTSATLGGYCLSLLGTDNAALGSACNGFLEPVTLPETGTYSVLVDPSGTATGSLSFKLWDVPADATYDASPSAQGDVKVVATTVPGQNGEVRLSGTAGQRIAMSASHSYSPSTGAHVSIKRPDGTTLVSSVGSFLDTLTLPTTGTYVISVNPQAAATGSATLTVWDVPEEASGSLTPSGAGGSSTVNTTVPGQNAKVTFTGAAGQQILATVSSETFPSWTSLWLRKPDGTTLQFITNNLSTGSSSSTLTLPVDGTYTLFVDPPGAATGSIGLTVYDVPADSTTPVTPTASGAQAVASTTVPGQRARVTWSGTAGQRIAFHVTEKTYPHTAYVTVLRPDGGTLYNHGDINYWHMPVFVEGLTLPTTGTYTILVDPYGSTTGSLTMHVYDVPGDFADTIAFDPAGDSNTVTTTPGQNGRLTFTATEGQEAALAVTAMGYASARVSLQNPNGTNLISPTYLTNPHTFPTVTLPATGTYTLTVDPWKAATGSATLSLSDASASLASASSSSRAGSGGPGASGPSRAARSQPPSASSAPGHAPFGLTDELPALGGGLLRDDAWMLRLGSGVDADWQTHQGNVVRARRLPGLELRLPAGSVLRDRDGRELEQLRISRVPARRAPARLPRGAADPLYISFQPGGAQPLRGTQLIYPNAAGARPGQRLYLWTYDLRRQQWLVYGRGTVTPDGQQVAPDPGAELSELTATATSTSRPARSEPPTGRPGPDLHARATVERHRPRPVRERPTGRTSAGAPRASSGQAGAGRRDAAPSLRSFEPRGSLVWRPQRRDRRGSWRTRQPDSPWASLPALKAADGATALAGQALKLDGTPLRGVTLGVEHSDATTRTDRTGRFLLEGLTAGHHVLVIDGASAARHGRRYGTYEIGVELTPGRTTELDHPIWMTALDPAGDTRVETPTKDEVVLRTARIPGLEIRIPAGSVIRDRDGKTVRDLNLTQVPVDRPPFPLPPFGQVPTYFTVQPGGAYLSKGARIIYPNYLHLPPGQRTNFWSYDPDQRGWHIYGRGTVTPDGSQVVPDPGVRVWELTGAMHSGSPNPPGDGPTLGGATGGDPVDLATGLFVYEKTDISLPDVLPIELTRTYRPSDTNSYAFGIGTNHPYDLRLWSVNNYEDVSLILPDGSRVFYVRTSPGSSWANAVYEAQSTPGPFYESRISWNGNGGWDLRLKDGTTYVFPEFAPVSEIRDRFGNTLRITRDSGQRITQITSPNRRWIRFTYDSSNRITQARDNGGRTTSYTYDPSGRLATATDVGGGLTTYTYNAANQMTAIQDPRGITYLQNDYDSNGRVSEQTLANGGTFEFDYTLDPGGKVTETSVTDPLGKVDQHGFNAAGYQTSETRAADTTLAQTTTYERQPGTNQLLSMTDPLNRETHYEYDASGNLVEVTKLADTPDAVTTAYAYEPEYNQLTTITDPLQHVTQLDYDDRGQLTSIEDASGRETTFAYTDDGLLSTVSNPAGEVTQLEWSRGDLSSIRDPLGNTTSYSTDSIGRVRSVTNPLGQRTRYDYNPHNQLTQVTDPHADTTTLAYDPNGNLTELTDARGNTTTATFDSMDQLTSRTDQLLETETYAYDENGNPTAFTDRRGKVTTYRYDELDRRTFAGFDTTGSPESPSYESTIAYTYDDADRLTQAVDSESGTVERSYDAFDRLTSETAPEGTVAYGYDTASRRATMTAPGQAPVVYSYDDANRLTGLSRAGHSVTIGYDTAGRRASTTLANGVTQSFSYDAASRLTGISYQHGAATLGDLSYEYDAAGRRTAVWGSYARTNLPTAMASATYDNANRRIAQDGATLIYDANGNLTSDAATPQNTYSWDARNRLSSISGGVNAEFSYDPFGRRTRRTVAGQTRGYVYDGGNVLQERTGGEASADLLTGLGLDETYARTTAGGTSSLLTDALGSTIALTDPFGIPTTTYTYDPFGNTTSAGPTNDNPYQYTRRENDGTGLYHYRARYYSAAMQRFLSEDPIGLAGGDVNLYAYVGNSPTGATDPLGLYMEVSDDIGIAPGGGAICFHGRKAGGGCASGGGGGGGEMCASGTFVGKLPLGGSVGLEADDDPGVLPNVGLGVGMSGGFFGNQRPGDCNDTRSAIEPVPPRTDFCLYVCTGFGHGQGAERGVGVNFNLFEINVSPTDVLDDLL